MVNEIVITYYKLYELLQFKYHEDLFLCVFSYSKNLLIK